MRQIAYQMNTQITAAKPWALCALRVTAHNPVISGLMFVSQSTGRQYGMNT